MVKVETLRDDPNVRILRCREGNRIWYQMWLSLHNWYNILYQGNINIEDEPMIKKWWLVSIQQYYVFFYEKNGRKVRGVLGKDKIKEILKELL